MKNSMKFSQSQKTLTFLATFSAGLILSFQNCSKVTVTDLKSQGPEKLENATAVIEQGSQPPSVNLCANISEIHGDMLVNIIDSASSNDHLLEFGTFADNYWDGDGQSNGNYQWGKVYDRKLEFYIDNPSELTTFTLTDVAFDDWIAIQLNGQVIYYGPYGGDRLIFDNSTGLVNYNIDQYKKAELSTSWKFSPQIDVMKYLVSGLNTLKVKTIVSGHGESAMRFLYRLNCN